MPDFEFTLPAETVKEALQRWAKGHRMPLRRQAELLGVPESTLANAVNPHIDSCHYQLRHLVPHTLLLQDFGMVDYLESCLGRVGFAMLGSPACVADLQAELARTIREFSDVVVASGEALEDGSLSRDEVVRAERDITLARTTAGYIHFGGYDGSGFGVTSASQPTPGEWVLLSPCGPGAASSSFSSTAPAMIALVKAEPRTAQRTPTPSAAGTSPPRPSSLRARLTPSGFMIGP